MGFKKAQMGLWPKMTLHSLNKVQNSIAKAKNGLNMAENDLEWPQKGSNGLNMAENYPN